MTINMCLFWAVLIFFGTTTLISAQDDMIFSDSQFGKPLFLTPYIESGNITEGRRLARVPFTDDLRVKSYAGFFTVNKAYNSNMYFWYFPAMVPSSKTVPVLLWLNGGPGFTSLFGLFAEHGPILIRNGKFERRKHHWALNYHIFYIDNPVGSGFSFTESPKGYCTDQIEIGADLYSAVTQFFQLFPELQKSKFFITGQSYAGKYVPALGYTIHKKNPTAALKINLGGMAIGNGLCDPVNQFSFFSTFLHQIGLLDFNQAAIFATHEARIVEEIKKKNYARALEIFGKLIHSDLQLGDRSPTILTRFTGFEYFYHFLHATDYINFPDNFNDMMEKPFVRRGMHVGNLPFNNGTAVRNALKNEFMQTVAPWLTVLINNYPVMLYNGQLDIILGFISTETFLKKLDFEGNLEYQMAKRHIWRVNGDIAGYVKRAGNLVEVFVRNAGHSVPTDQPVWSLDMINRFTEDRWDNLHN